MTDTPDTPEEENEPDVRGELPPWPACEKCGEVHARKSRGVWVQTCSAHKKVYIDGDRFNVDPDNIRWGACMKYCPVGLHICSHHGGSAPHVLMNNKKFMEMAELGERLRLEAAEVNPVFLQQHPVQGLLEEVARSAQIVEWLAIQTAKLELIDPANYTEDAYVAGMMPDGTEARIPVRSMLIGPDDKGNLKRHPLWQALDAERERHAKLCKTALDAGVNERMVNIAETQATRMVSIMLKVIDSPAIDIDPEIRIALRRAIAVEMRAAGPSGMAAIEARASG